MLEIVCSNRPTRNIKVQDAIVWSRYSADYRNALDFYIISWSSLGFSAKFQPALSSTRLNSCTLSQRSPNRNSSIRTALA